MRKPVPTLILDNLPPDVFERLRKLAAANNQTVAAEAVQQLRLLLPDPPFLTEEVSVPCNLPLPGEKVRVQARNGHLPPPDPPLFAEERW